MEPSNVSLKFDLGNISNQGGFLSLCLEIQGNGVGSMYAYANEKGKRTGHLISLSLKDYYELRKIIRNTDELLKSLSEKGQLEQIGKD